MSIKHQIFWLRVKYAIRHNVAKAVEMLVAAGATLAKAVRYVAAAKGFA